MKNKHFPVLIGIYQCPNCGNISTHQVVPEHRRSTLFFTFTGVPLNYSKKVVSCSHCNFTRKLKGEFKAAYQKALTNHFDDEYTVKQFINKIEETCINYEVLSDGIFNQENFEKAVNEIYEIYSAVQGYDRDFYYAFCELFALQAEEKLKRFRLMFRK